jgi:hypothetical protein
LSSRFPKEMAEHTRIRLAFLSFIAVASLLSALFCR